MITMEDSPPQMPIPMLDIPQSRSNRWSDFFLMPCAENDDLMWSDYIKKAEDFDKRLVDDLNEIVDVILIYDTLFISVLNTFVVDSSTKFTPDAGDVTDKLLNATYLLLAAQHNNISINPTMDTSDFFNLDETAYKTALISNALLYTAIALCTVVSVIALAAKLWLVSYSDRTFNLVGLPYDRSVKRQQAYNGVLAWKMKAVINTMPVFLLIATLLFGFYIHISACALDVTIGYVVAVVMTLGFVLLAMTSLAAAFIPECPFYSPFSATIKVVFEYLRKIFPFRRRVRFVLAFLFCVGSGAAIAYGTLQYSGNILALVFIPLSVTFSYAMEDKEDEIKKDEAKRKSGAKKHEDEEAENKEECRKPQRYRLPHFALGGFIIIGSILSAAGYFTSSESRKIFIILYCIGMSLLFIVGMGARKLAKSSKKTRVVDAMAWLLNSESTPCKIEPLVKKIGKITMGNDKDGYNHYRARLLESLMPLLSSLITSPRTKTLYDSDRSQLSDLETYVSCLALLSDFKDDPLFRWKSLRHLHEDAKSLLHLREDAKIHPILEESLRQKLVELIKDSRSEKLTDAAEVVLYNFGLGKGGDILPRPMHGFEIPEPMQDFGDSSSITTIVEPLAEHYEMKLKRQSRHKGYSMLDAV